MFKHLLTLTRGRVTDGSEAFLGAHALPLLRQQMRDAAMGVEKSRRAVAVVIAYGEREKTQLARIESQIDDLENRALSALSQGREDLANQAAETISQLEAERDTTRAAITTYQTQVNRLKQTLIESETCLRALQRGQHLAEANDKANRLNGTMPSAQMNDLHDAQNTLKRLQLRQDHAQETANALEKLSGNASADVMAKRLAEAGCGEADQPNAAAVLARLKAKAAQPAPQQSTK